jgi:hypothetical protein
MGKISASTAREKQQQQKHQRERGSALKKEMENIEETMHEGRRKRSQI